MGSKSAIQSARILCRQSTVGSSLGTLYGRSPEGVPFKWEEEPGKPIEPRPHEVLPPLSPPPALVSLGFPKPSIQVNDVDWEDDVVPAKMYPRWVWERIKRRMSKVIVEVLKRRRRSK